MKLSLPARAVVVAAMALGSAVGLAQDKPEMAKPDGDMTLACKAPSAKAKTPLLKFEASTPFPDHTVLKVNLKRSYEDFSYNRVVAMQSDAGGGAVEVKGKKFVFEPPVEGPGAYALQVMYLDEFQRQTVKDMLKGKVDKKLWKFEFLAWTDDLIPQLGPKLEDIAALSRESLDMLKRFDDAVQSEQTWRAMQKDLVALNAKLQRKLETSDAKAFFPASLNQIFYTIRSVQGTSPYFHFENGKFAGGKSYHADNQEIKSHRNEPFTFMNLRKYCDEAVPLAGRELGLWLVKDMKRAGMIRPEVQDALKKYATHPGLAPFVERLTAATPADLETLEKDLRGAPLLEGTDPKDPKKPADPKK
jgi:hypothetical protein